MDIHAWAAGVAHASDGAEKPHEDASAAGGDKKEKRMSSKSAARQVQEEEAERIGSARSRLTKHNVLPPIGAKNMDAPTPAQAAPAQGSAEEDEDEVAETEEDLAAVQSLREQLRLQQLLLEAEYEMEQGQEGLTPEQTQQAVLQTMQAEQLVDRLQTASNERARTASSRASGSRSRHPDA
eukprot:m.33893 g.33893  ORF g.33893 m.33893 type:complete len:181 (-) comp9496_c1_seq1:38-580(-)